MYRVLCRVNNLKNLKNNCHMLKRFFLSDAFKCAEAWENRLNTPVFQKIKLGHLFSELDKNLASDRLINVLDIDIFINAVRDENYLNEVEDLLLRLRSHPETSVMYERTSHAAIRTFLALNKKSDLLNILSQRMLYGVFPDIYLSILMIDTFLKENDVISAVKIAVLQMLQEDCNYPIFKELSLYSCIKYLNSSDAWITPKEEIDEDEEVVKYRIDYARNEYYDDHFDIVNTNHLVGKTMCAFAKTSENPIGTSCRLIGLVLHEKFELAKEFVTEVIKNSLPIHKEAVEKAKSYIESTPKQVVEGENKTESEGKNDDSKDGESNVNAEVKEDSPIKMELVTLLNHISNKNILSVSLEETLEQLVKEQIKMHENNYIQEQCKIYKNWEQDRIKNCEKEMETQKKNNVRKEIDELKAQLAAEEQRLFYYDKEIEHDEMVEKKREELDNFEYYKPKRKVKPFPQMGYLPPNRRWWDK